MTHTYAGPATNKLTAATAAALVLDEYPAEVAARPSPYEGFEDAGMMVLAVALAQVGAAATGPSIGVAARQWLSLADSGQSDHLGLHGRGFGGCVLALSSAAEVWPSCQATARLARVALAQAAASGRWSAEDRGWPDYDLATGPAGILVALLGDTSPSPSSARLGDASLCSEQRESEVGVSSLVRGLVDACAEDDLSGLVVRRYAGDPMRGFNVGRVNTGVPHGVAGVALALVAAADAGRLPERGFDALRRIGAWLAAQTVTDGNGLRTWLPAGRNARERERFAGRTPHRSVREGWCAGAPGVSWALWETARVLGDDRLTAHALEVASSFVTAYADDRYLDDEHPNRTGMCHGAAGTMMVFDAFHRHAGLPGALGLRDHLADLLDDELPEIVAAEDGDHSLFAGSTGALTALLTVRHGTSRRWLRAFGLR